MHNVKYLKGKHETVACRWPGDRDSSGGPHVMSTAMSECLGVTCCLMHPYRMADTIKLLNFISAFLSCGQPLSGNIQIFGLVCISLTEEDMEEDMRILNIKEEMTDMQQWMRLTSSPTS